MRFVTPLLRWLSALVFHFSLFFVIGAFAFVFLIGNEQTLKDTLVESEIYNKFIPSIIDANLDQTRDDLSSLPLDDINVRSIIRQSFAPQTLREQTEVVIDDVYAWLEGRTDYLEFSYDFTESKEAMNNGIANYAAQRVLSLPDCEVAFAEVNVFNVDCKPAGFSFEFVRSQVLNDLQSSDFLKSPIINQDNLPKSPDGKTLEEQYSYVPTIFQILQGGIFISIILVVLSATLFVYVRRPLSKGFQALGRDLLSNGVMLILLTIGFGFLLPRYTDTFSIQGNATSALFNQVSDLYIQKIDIIVINVAIQIAAVGLGIMLIGRINKVAGGYRNARAKSGLITSNAVKRSTQPRGTSKRPPIQTSEVEKPSKSRKPRSKKRKSKISRPGS